MSAEDDDMPQLSDFARQALEEHFLEQQKREEMMEKILRNDNDGVEDVEIGEDWQLSQFWYDDQTVNNLVRGALKATEDDGKIALISCPTLYKQLKKEAGNRTVTLFEYDTRFSIYGKDFVPYDYNFPLKIPRDVASMYDLVIADPPFLSEECLMKTSDTIKFLMKKNIVLCTGAIMEELADRFLSVHKCKFQPHHKNNLANEFYCYSNFDFDQSLK